MANNDIIDIQRIFTSRLMVLEHILNTGAKHLDDFSAVMEERLAPDMFPLATQISFACNQPRGFAQWCAGQPVENYSADVISLDDARSRIQETRDLVCAIDVTDDKLRELKRIGLGPGRYCELPGRMYVSEYLMPNFYFHISTAYAILRKLGVPVGKADFMAYLAPYVKQEN